MSQLSQAIFGPAAAPPKPKPTMTLAQAQALARKHNPLLGLPRTDVGLGLQAQKNAGGKLSASQLRSGVAGMNAAQNAAGKRTAATISQKAAPTLDVLAKISNGLETPFTLGGAAIQDFDAGRRPSLSSHDNSALGHALDLMARGQFGEARKAYSFTSWDSIRTMAKHGDGAAQFLLKHPTVGSLLMGGAELVNPASIGVGKAAGALGDLARVGANAGGRAAANALSRARPGVAGGTLDRVLRNAGDVATGARFGAVRNAAAREAAAAGGSRVAQSAAADRADVVSRIMAHATPNSVAQMQNVTQRIFGGLLPEQQNAVVDMIEGLHQSSIKNAPADAAKRVATYRAWRNAVDTRTKANGLGEAGMWYGPTYFPRRGMTLDPALEQSEEQTLQDEQIANRRSRGGQNIRKDTLGQNVPSRKYATRQQAIFNGVKLNPDWTPAQALYEHGITRLRSNALAEGAQELKKLGLVVPRETADMWGHTVPHRADYLPFTELGSVRTYGDPLLRESAVDPSVADLIEDLGATSGDRGLPGPLQALTAAGRGVNEAASRVLVSQPLYHLPVNVIPNALADVATGQLDPLEAFKALLSPKKSIAEARAAGADFPYVEHSFDTRDLAPPEGLTAAQKVGRGARKVARGVNAVSNRALYQYAQPAVAAAAYKGLKKRLGSDAAALEVRSIVGEPENLTAAERSAGQAFMFPGWLKSQVRRWGGKLATNPQLYMAPHTAVNARNESKGVSPDPFSWASLIPPIVLHVDPTTGDYTQLPVPNPANRVTGFVDALANLATGNGNGTTLFNDLTNTLNPGLNALQRLGTTLGSPAHAPTSQILWDKDNPDARSRALQALASLGGRYSPVRGALPSVASALESLVGVAPKTQLSAPRAKERWLLENDLREGYPYDSDAIVRSGGLEGLERLEKKLRTAGRTGDAAKVHAAELKLYKLLQHVEAAK